MTKQDLVDLLAATVEAHGIVIVLDALEDVCADLHKEFDDEGWDLATKVLATASTIIEADDDQRFLERTGVEQEEC
jgi:hypothetical protein